MRNSIVGDTWFHFSSIHSTQSFLIDFLSNQKAEEYVWVSAFYQEKGVGQRGSSWQGEKEKNIALSFSVKNVNHKAAKVFNLNKALGICLLEWLAEYSLEAEIKWPNDILVNGKKIAGVLVNTVISGKELKQAIIGIGINVNQTQFEDFSRKATSLKLETGNRINLVQSLESLKEKIDQRLDQLLNWNSLNDIYLSRLYLYKQWAEYKIEGKTYYLRQIGVDEFGRLQLINRAGEVKTFDLKQIEFLA